MGDSVFSDIGSGVATALSAVGSFIGGERTNRQNMDIWRKTQDWQEYMSNTAYQRAVADMKKAGINPMLLVSKGFTGATTPGGMTGAPMQNTLGQGVSTGLQAASLQAQLKKNVADINEVNSRTALNFATIANTAATTAKARALQPLYDLAKVGTEAATHSARSVISGISGIGSIASGHSKSLSRGMNSSVLDPSTPSHHIWRGIFHK